MPEPVVQLLLAGLALVALAGWYQARRWRRAYQRSLAQFGTLLTVQNCTPAKSAAHVKAARTRADRERAKRLAVAQRLAAEAAARSSPEDLPDPHGLIRSGWQ